MRAEQEELIDQQMRLAELRGRLRKQWAEQKRSPEEIKDFLLYVLGFRAEDEERALTERAFALPLQRSKELLWRCRLEVRRVALRASAALVRGARVTCASSSPTCVPLLLPNPNDGLCSATKPNATYQTYRTTRNTPHSWVAWNSLLR